MYFCVFDAKEDDILFIYSPDNAGIQSVWTTKVEDSFLILTWLQLYVFSDLNWVSLYFVIDFVLRSIMKTRSKNS